MDNCNSLFKDCSDIVEIDLSSFDASQVYQMNYMFQGCSSLTSINLSNVNTSLVTLMNNMFDNCYSLLSLDLSSFNTSLVTLMESMFSNCTSLSSLNLSNFNKHKCGSARQMFTNCTSLEYLNIENFIFFQGEDYEEIFKFTPKNLIICANESNIKGLTNPINLDKCTIISCSDDWREKRKKLNIENNTCVDNCENIFKIEKDGKCIEAPEIQCSKETPFVIINEQNCVSNCSIDDLVKVNCILSKNLNDSEDIILNYTLNYLKSNSFSKEIFENNDYISFKEKRVKLTLSKLFFDKGDSNICKEYFNGYYNIYENINFYLLNISISQDNSLKSKNVYEIYYNIPENNDSLIKINLNELSDICSFKTEISKCDSYSIESIINDSCLSCASIYGYYPMSIFNTNNFFSCYKKIIEQNNTEEINFTDYNNIQFNNTIIPECKKNNSKYIQALNICIDDCSKSNLYKYEFNDTCYDQCPFNTTKSKKNEFYCSIECPKEKPYEQIGTIKCIENCTVNDMFKNLCRINYKEENKTKNEDLGKHIFEEILNGNLSELLEQIIKEKSYFIIEEENSMHQISSLDFQMNDTRFSSIDFGQCKDYFIQKYSINETKEELIIYKIEHIIEGFNIPIIEYVLFTQNGSISLDLSICENILIQYNVRTPINENDIDKYDPSSDFYNDKCNKYSTEGKVDMTLFDRKKEYNENNMSLCESKCIFQGYNSTTSKAICNCHIKNNMTYSYDDSSINKNELLNKIQSDKSNSNIDIVQCMEVFSSPEELKSNCGFFLLLFILIILIIVSIIFWVKGRELLKNKIDEVIYNKFEKNQKPKDKKEKIRQY